MVIATKNVTINAGKGRPIVLVKNQKVTPAAQRRMTTRQIESYTETVSRRTGGRNEWTHDEVAFIAHLYHTMTDADVNGENAQNISAAFRSCYDTHTDAAIIMTIGQAKAIDSRYDAVGLSYSQALVSALRAIDAERYIG